MTVPADASLWSRHDESFGHYRRYDAERFARVWQGLPATCHLTSYYNSRLYPAVKLVRWWNRRHGAAHGAAGTDFSMPLAPVNRCLEWILADESRHCWAWFRARRHNAYGHGVSLVALVRREPGDCPQRARPLDVAADLFSPGRRCQQSARCDADRRDAASTLTHLPIRLSSARVEFSPCACRATAAPAVSGS